MFLRDARSHHERARGQFWGRWPRVWGGVGRGDTLRPHRAPVFLLIVILVPDCHRQRAVYPTVLTMTPWDASSGGDGGEGSNRAKDTSSLTVVV